MNSSPTGRREAAKAERRGAILDAALELIDASDGGARYASVEAIARRAGVAPATVYNLFGTRDAILAGLVRRMAAEIVGGPRSPQPQDPHPLDPLLPSIDLVCAQFDKRPRAWAHIILRLGDIATTTGAGASNGSDLGDLLTPLWQSIQTAGVVQRGFSPATLALQTYATANGALLRWAAGRISLSTLQLLLRHTILLIATAAADQAHARNLADELRTTNAQLAIAMDQDSNRISGAAPPGRPGRAMHESDRDESA